MTITVWQFLLAIGLPSAIISAAVAEAAVLPTAVLSVHTAFTHVYKRDLSEDMEAIFASWEQEKIAFDFVYTGYLASPEQTGTVSRFLDRLPGGNKTVFVDPVMGDFGRLYTGFHATFPDVIVPNLTEACALLNEPYREDFTRDQLTDLLRRLCAMGAKCAVLTGVSPVGDADKLGVLKYDGRDGSVFSYYGERVRTSQPLHGTGDVFASACVGALAAGMCLDDALSLAVEFTSRSAACWAAAADRRWYGVDFETALPYYIDEIRSYTKKI